MVLIFQHRTYNWTLPPFTEAEIRFNISFKSMVRIPVFPYIEF